MRGVTTSIDATPSVATLFNVIESSQRSILCYLRNLGRFLGVILWRNSPPDNSRQPSASAVSLYPGGLTSTALSSAYSTAKPCLRLPSDLRSSLYACHPRPVNGYPEGSGPMAA